MSFFVATTETPLLNTPDFKKIFGGLNGSLPFDCENLVRALEMIALPSTVFEIKGSHGQNILEVQTAEYPSLTPLFLDKRFGKVESSSPPARGQALPSPQTILERLKSRVGKPYIWGGNVSAGIPQMLHYYPPLSEKVLSPLEKVSWTFEGVDCSGLLYEVCNGAVPRNTDALLFVGESVPIAHLSWEEIPQVLKPLDLLIWKGHMVIVFDHEWTIESKLQWGGVTLTGMKKRLASIRDEDRKKPADDPIHVLQNSETFLVRRFLV